MENSAGPAGGSATFGPGGRTGTAARWLSYLKARPILCLALLTPGIPEYLSTSSPVLSIVTNPAFFFLQILINVGQYTAGALLIREAMIRWKKGWGTVFLLGLAYGITEEGLGDNTLFNATRGMDGILGSFGRFEGVNWVWSVGVLAFHVIYSIGLPILLLNLALPSTRGRSLLSRQGMALAFATLAVSTATETLLVYAEFHFWMGPALLVGSLVAIGLLTYAGYRLPRSAGLPPTERPVARPWEAGTIGFLFFPIAFVLEYGFAPSAVPAALVILVELLIFAALFERVRRRIGRTQNEALLVALAFGFVLWQGVFGILLTLGLPYQLPLAAVAIYFFLRLRRAYPAREPPGSGLGPPPLSAAAP